MRPRGPARGERGMTLVELVVAAGLFAMLMVALFTMLDDFLSLWEKSELRRRQVEESSAVVELIASDLASLEPGPRGDLLAEWAFFDTDGDGVRELMFPRLRFVRHAGPAEIARLQVGREERELGEGLVEVIWTVLPARGVTQQKDLRAEGYLWRGVRLYGSKEGVPFLGDEYLSGAGRPTAGTVHEVTGGVLWMGMQFAGQATVLHDGWKTGTQLTDALPGWDAWKRGRANRERHVWNDFGEGLPEPRGRPLLPRRVRLELELEHEKDLKKRTRLSSLVGPLAVELVVDNGDRLPKAGGHVKLGGEWMEVLSVSGDRAAVRRAVRGTQPATHETGALVHWGDRMVREVPISSSREDWRL